LRRNCEALNKKRRIDSVCRWFLENKTANISATLIAKLLLCLS
jgi:hypothetical protein